jgi:hypothetical protein
MIFMSCYAVNFFYYFGCNKTEFERIDLWHLFFFDLIDPNQAIHGLENAHFLSKILGLLSHNSDYQKKTMPSFLLSVRLETIEHYLPGYTQESTQNYKCMSLSCVYSIDLLFVLLYVRVLNLRQDVKVSLLTHLDLGILTMTEYRSLDPSA